MKFVKILERSGERKYINLENVIMFEPKGDNVVVYTVNGNVNVDISLDNFLSRCGLACIK